MDTQSLKAFLAVAESQSFSQAAMDLFITQSAVSKRIQLLESQLNTPLFHRHNRTVSLTHAGHTLLPKAQAILDMLYDSEQEIINLQNHVSGQLNIATSHHIGLHRLPKTLRTFVKQFPKAELNLNFMVSEVAQQAVKARQVEMALITLDHRKKPPADTTSELLWTDTMVCVCSPNHSLAKVEKMTLQELAKHPAILPEPDTITFQLVADIFKQQQLNLTTPMPTNYLETIKMLVSVGMGWTVLPANMIDSSLHPLVWPGPTIERQLGVIYLKQRTLSNAATALIQLLRSDARLSQELAIEA